MAQSSLVSEIVEQLASFQLGAEAPRTLTLVLPLRAGSRDAVRRLLAHGPPFDIERIAGLERYDVFMSTAEVIFVFEVESGLDAMARLIARPELWEAAGAWQEHVDGAPRLAENVYSWVCLEEAGELSFLPTPGPGDSDGGDIF